MLTGVVSNSSIAHDRVRRGKARLVFFGGRGNRGYEV